MSKFIHLKAQSDYSLGRSIVKVQDLVDSAVNAQMPALCLMDKGNLFGSLEFSMACVKKGVKPIIGCQILVDCEQSHDRFLKRNIHDYGTFSVIAKNKIGYQNLLTLVSNSYLKNCGHTPHIKLDELLMHQEGLILLFDSFHSPMAHLLNANNQKDGALLISRLQDSFREDIFLDLYRTSSNNWQNLEGPLLELAFEKNIPVVATNPIAFLKRESSQAHDALLCIVQSRYLVEEEREKTDPDLYFKVDFEMQNLFEELPEAIENTYLIALKASVMPEVRQPMLPKFSHTIDDEDLELKNQALHGLEHRLRHSSLNLDKEAYLARLHFELETIIKMQFSGYFLIVSDFIKWSKKQAIPVGPGRGSGAGSIVAWALEITDLDPMQFGLLFERFLNPERVSMPDFDIDFCQERRDEVIQYVKHKYGQEKVAQIITFGKLQARAVLRDVGRVMQIPYGVVDKICKVVPNNPANPVTLSEAIEIDKELQNMREEDADIARLLSISLELEGINRHVSTHAAGIIIADKPLIELVPLYIDSNSTMQTVQYSLKYADAAGLMKFDFLGLKTLTVINKAIKLVKEHRGINVEFCNIHFDDKKTYEMLSAGDTAGVFQFEGAGVRDAIKQLKPDCLEDLIALTSLYRPGPMDNIASYINRKHGIEEPDYIHPKLQTLLQETYGIIIYQEQVMQIAQLLAGYSLGEADLLRRAMGKKNKQEMEKQRELFVERCQISNITRARAEEIFALIDKFASYGFNKSHAAAYATISYQTAFLKTHYLAEFLVASMNLEINDTAKIGFFCNEAKHFGLRVLPPDINKSCDYFVVEGENIRYALGAIKGVSLKAISELQEERKRSQFESMEDFFARSSHLINKRSAENLVKAGVFDMLHSNRAELYKNLEEWIKWSRSSVVSSQQPNLFALDDGSSNSRFCLCSEEEWSSRKKLNFEFEALGFYFSSNPLDEYAERMKKMAIVSALELDSMRSGKYLVMGVVTAKRVRSSKRGKYAFLQLTDKTGVIDLAIFSEKLLIANNDLLVEGNAVICNIEIKQDESNRRLIVESVSELHQYMASAVKVCHFYIKNKDELRDLLSLLGDSGLLVKLYVKFPGKGFVSFATKNPLYISMLCLEELKKKNSIEIVEE